MGETEIEEGGLMARLKRRSERFKRWKKKETAAPGRSLREALEERTGPKEE